MRTLAFFVFFFSFNSPIRACDKLNFGKESHKQLWLALVYVKELKGVPFTNVGNVKVSNLKFANEVSSLESSNLRDSVVLDSISEEMHKYLVKYGAQGSSDDIEIAIVDQVEKDGKVCDLADEIEKFYKFKK